jgi:hypothetical protein
MYLETVQMLCGRKEGFARTSTVRVSPVSISPVGFNPIHPKLAEEQEQGAVCQLGAA